MITTAYIGADIFDSDAWHSGKALIVVDELISGIVEVADIPESADIVQLDGGMLVPGFIDLQVNGGGGVMLNDERSVEGIATICRAHAQFGTTALLPTLITDTPEITAQVIAAGAQAALLGIPGFLGLHLEGPHLSITRKGAHDPKLIRPMEAVDLDHLVAARKKVPVLLTTIATESVSPEQVAAMVQAGIIVSLGHTDTTQAKAHIYTEAGIRTVTHLFNAMSQLGNREPGLVGEALDSGALFAGIIADGIHVDPVSIGAALRAKRGPGRIFLVTDAMSTIGTDMTSFTLNGRTIYRSEGKLRLEDGTLAGADLDMISAVCFMHRTIGLDLGEALRMASLYPAQAVRVDDSHGRLKPGYRANMVHLSSGLDVRQVWIEGETAHIV